MPNKLLCLAMIFISIASYSQKTDSDKVKFSYVEYPKKPLPLSVKKYNLLVLNGSGQILPSQDAIANKLKLDGFTLTSQNPDVLLVLVVDKITTSSTVLSAVVGNNVTNYFYTADVTMKASIRFTTPDRKEEFYFADSFEQPLWANVKSQYYPNEAAAKEELKKYPIANLLKQCIDNSLEVLSYYVASNFGYSKKNEVLPIYTITGSDYDYTDIAKAKDNYVKAMEIYTAQGLTDESKKLLEESVAIWSKNIGEYKADDKKARISSKNILELYMNMTMANLWLQNFSESKKYLDLAAKEKGLNGIKNAVNDILLASENAYNLNQLRQQDKLTIERKESEIYVAPEFLITTNPYRIKYLEYYNEYNPANLEKRRVFEYDVSGLLKKVYTQKYDRLTKTFSGETDVYTLSYDNKDKTMSIYKDYGKIPEYSQTFANGKMVTKAGTVRSVPFNYAFFYNASGQLRKYTNKTSGNTEHTNLSYEQNQLKSIVKYKISAKDSIPDAKINLTWQADKLATVDFYYNVAGAKEFSQKAYSNNYEYDIQGKLMKIKGGAQTYNYKYDAAGNMIELIISSDTTPTHYTYVWESGSGNASLFLLDADLPTENPIIYPLIK